MRAPLCLNLLERADGKTEQKEKNIHERGKRILKVGSQRLEDLGGGAHRGIVVLVDDVITSGGDTFSGVEYPRQTTCNWAHRRVNAALV